MSHKKHLFPDFFNEEAIISRDAIVNRLLKKEKPPIARKGREPSVTRTARDKSPAKKPTPQLRARSRSMGRGRGSTTTAKKNAKEAGEPVMIKTVKEKSPRRPRSPSSTRKGETWSQLLKQSRGKSTFKHFDPLRTLHFLIKELECRVQNDIPEDMHLQQIVHDMLAALNRVPPEMASNIHLHQSPQSDHQEKELKTLKTGLITRSVQTPKTFYVDDAEVFRKEVEASTAKLEESCKQMEIFCEKIKHEKQELDRRLKYERDTVKSLKKRVEELEEEAKQKEIVIKQLTKETVTLKEQTSTAAKDQLILPPHVKTIIKDLTAQKLEAEKERITLRHKLALSDLEKEKYVTMLTVRERQCQEMKHETLQLQEMIKRQLMELHSGVTESEQNVQEKNNDINASYDISSIHSGIPDIEDPEKHKNAISFIELPSGNSSAVAAVADDHFDRKTEASNYQNPSKDLFMKGSEGSLSISQSSIPETLKQIFDELKREAYSITADLYNHS